MRVYVIGSMDAENVISNLEKLAEELQTNDEYDSYAEQVLKNALNLLKCASEEEVTAGAGFEEKYTARRLFERIQQMPPRDRLESVAEEAAEVEQAALKYIRAKRLSVNPTPIDDTTAWANLCEEVADLCLALEVSGFDVKGILEYAKGTKNPKLKRWVERLDGVKKTEGKQ